MPILPDSTIQGWTVTILTRFLEDWFKNHPLPTVESLEVGTLKVNESLEVVKDLSLDAFTVHVVGSTGQPAYTNGWAIYGAPYPKAAFVKDVNGWIRLLGVIKSGTLGTSAFTLPPGYRPKVTPGPFAVVSNGGFGRVDVGADGTVTPQSPSSNLSVSLEGIAFLAT